MDLLIDETTNDIVLKDGEFLFTTTNDIELRQKILLRLVAFRGEWELDPAFGMPYRQEIFQKIKNKAQIDALFLNEINSVAGVEEITEFLSEFNKISRQYEIVRLIVKSDQGEQTRVSLKHPDNIEYPAPPQESTFICEI